MQQASYAMGVDIGRSLKQMKEQGAEIDLKVFTDAMQAVYDGKEIKMTEEQITGSDDEIPAGAAG